MTDDADLLDMTPSQLVVEVIRLRKAIRAHRDSTGHALCWWHPELWGLLPESRMRLPVAPPREEFLRRCGEYRDSMGPGCTCGQGDGGRHQPGCPSYVGG